MRNEQDAKNLKKIIRGCDRVIKELSAVVPNYKSLSPSRQRNWDRLRLGVRDLGDLKAKLV